MQLQVIYFSFNFTGILFHFNRYCNFKLLLDGSRRLVVVN